MSNDKSWIESILNFFGTIIFNLILPIVFFFAIRERKVNVDKDKELFGFCSIDTPEVETCKNDVPCEFILGQESLENSAGKMKNFIVLLKQLIYYDFWGARNCNNNSTIKKWVFIGVPLIFIVSCGMPLIKKLNSYFFSVESTPELSQNAIQYTLVFICIIYLVRFVYYIIKGVQVAVVELTATSGIDEAIGAAGAAATAKKPLGKLNVYDKIANLDVSVYQTVLWSSVEFSLVREIQISMIHGGKMKDAGTMALFTQCIAIAISLLVSSILFGCRAYGRKKLDKVDVIGVHDTVVAFVKETSPYYIFPFVIAPVLAFAYCLLIGNGGKRKASDSASASAQCSTKKKSTTTTTTKKRFKDTASVYSGISPSLFCELYSVFVVMCIMVTYVVQALLYKPDTYSGPSILITAILVVSTFVIQLVLFGIYRARYGSSIS